MKLDAGKTRAVKQGDPAWPCALLDHDPAHERELIALVRARAGEEQFHRVLGQPRCELDGCFLGFLEVYDAAARCIPRDFTVLDLGCAYAAQCWLFDGHARYVGVGPVGDARFSAPNTEHVVATIQEFTARNAELCARGDVAAVCSYVPDFAATELAARTFAHCLVVYPGRPLVATGVFSALLG